MSTPFKYYLSKEHPFSEKEWRSFEQGVKHGKYGISYVHKIETQMGFWKTVDKTQNFMSMKHFHRLFRVLYRTGLARKIAAGKFYTLVRAT